MAITYEPIATTTLSSSAATVTFSSISSAYTDLVIVGSIKAASATNPQTYVRFNGDTGSNYSVTTLSGNGTSAFAINRTNETKIRFNYYVDPPTTEYCTVIMNLQNYSNTTIQKTILSKLILGTGSGSGIDITTGLWRNTSAISQITFTLEATASDFASGCVFTLYGILKA